MIETGMTTDRIIDLVGTWFAALATLSASLVALFLPKLYRPRLSVSCNQDGIGSSSYLAAYDSDSKPIEELWIKVGVKYGVVPEATDIGKYLWPTATGGS